MEAGETNEVTNVSVMNTADIAEELPNADSEVEATVPQAQTVVSVSTLPSVLVATSQGIPCFGDQLQEATAIKTTHIVIHDQSAIDSAVLKTSQSPLTPTPNPLTPLSSGGERKFKYSWDSSVFDNILPVRCRNIKGELHKNRFGSGGRGRCIQVGDDWYTPSEFEALCGRGNSKDWKRSIRYAGRTLQCLIEEGIIQPHATSCTCSACCDNAMVVSGGVAVSSATSGPVRLFTPYKRRKKEEKRHNPEPISTTTENSVSDSLVVSLAPTEVSPSGEMQVVTATTNLVDATAESVIVTPVSTPQTPRTAPTALDFSEQRQWWQLEEMVKNVVRQVQELQKQVEAVKAQSAAAREAALQQLKLQMENEKKEALNTSRIEAQMNLSRAILEAKAEKEVAIQQALQQARVEMQEKLEAIVADKGDVVKRESKLKSTLSSTVLRKNASLAQQDQRCANCDREAYSECTGCHSVSYCSTFCQRKDWINHQEECGDSIITGEECGEEPAEG